MWNQITDKSIALALPCLIEQDGSQNSKFFLKQLEKIQSVFQMKPGMCQMLNYIANTHH